MSLLARGRAPIERGLLYWGIGLWLAALIPSLFIQSLLLQIFYPDHARTGFSGRPADYLLTLLGAFITALFVAVAMALLLRRRREQAGDLESKGMALGFGIGLIAQVFNGLILVGAGFRLMFGDASAPALQAAATIGLLDLVLSLLALVLFRPTLLVVSAVQGVMVARSVGGRWRYFWLAVLIDMVFAWAILGLKMALGGTNPGQVQLADPNSLISLVTLVYYGLAFGLAYRWLAGQMEYWNRATEAGAGRNP